MNDTTLPANSLTPFSFALFFASVMSVHLLLENTAVSCVNKLDVFTTLAFTRCSFHAAYTAVAKQRQACLSLLPWSASPILELLPACSSLF